MEQIFPRQKQPGQQRKPFVKSKSFSSGVSNMFKGIDIYGQQINLTYKGDDTFKTMPGAVTSLMIISLIVAFTVVRSIVLFNRQDPNISKASFQMDLDQAGEFRPQDSGFDIAFGIGEHLDPKYGYYQAKLVHFYYSGKLDSKGQLERLKEKIDIPFKECGKDLLNYQKQADIEKYGIDKQMCFSNDNYSLQGDYYSDEFRYIELRLYKCANTSKSQNCARNEQIDEFFNSKKFSMPFVNQFFDFSDFQSPVKPYIDDSLFWELDMSTRNSANFYIQQQQAQLQDDLLQLGQQDTLTFAQVSNQRTYDDGFSSSDNIICSIFIRFDNRYDIYNRQVYSILVLLGDIGGLQQSLYLLGLIMIGFFSRRIFVSSILKQIYQIKYWQDERDQDKKRIERENQKLIGSDKNKNQDTYMFDNQSPVIKPQRSGGSFNQFDYGKSQQQRTIKINASTSDLDQTKIHNQSTISNNHSMQTLQINDSSPLQSPNKTFENLNQIDDKQLKMEKRDGSQEIDIKDKQKFSIENALKYKDKLLESEINTILLNLINRRRFSYSGKDIVRYIFDCICCKKFQKIKHSQKYKNHFIFKKGEEKLQEELNVVNLLRMIRQVKLMTQVLMDQKQKLILRFQRKNLIETSSSSQDSDNNNKFDSFKIMESKNPMIRLVFFGKMKKMMMSYKNTKIENIDRRLFRGLFMRNLKDFDEDYKEKISNKSLLMRLRQAMITSQAIPYEATDVDHSDDKLFHLEANLNTIKENTEDDPYYHDHENFSRENLKRQSRVSKARKNVHENHILNSGDKSDQYQYETFNYGVPSSDTFERLFKNMSDKPIVLSSVDLPDENSNLFENSDKSLSHKYKFTLNKPTSMMIARDDEIVENQVDMENQILQESNLMEQAQVTASVNNNKIVNKQPAKIIYDTKGGSKKLNLKKKL